MLHVPDLTGVFSETYAEARRKFLAMAARYGAEVRTYVEDGAGPDGEELATDTAWFGPKDAAAVMVLTSATHGVEGFCGSGAQLDFLLQGGPARLPEGVAALVVHAVNPFGFAWLRRVTQEGVDLNRNGIDFSAPPENPEYTRLQALFRPRKPGSPEAAETLEALTRYRREVGEVEFAIARGSGQYVDPQGIYYGGTGPTWSRRTMERLIAEYDLRSRRQVAVIDYHTGLGPFGYGEPICGCRPTEPGAARGRAWYGDSMTEPMKGTSTSVVIPGLVQYIWLRELSAEQLTFIALEYGTYPRSVIEPAVDGEQWLHSTAFDWNTADTQAAKRAMRHAFFPDTDDWKEMILARSRQVIRQTVSGLADELQTAR